MADKARKDLPRSGAPGPPSLRETVTTAALAEVLSVAGEVLRAPRPEKSTTCLHWEDAVDLNAPAFPLKKNPSAWSHRIKVALLACVGAILAAYMSLYQLHLIDSVWDPVFGQGTERMLTSKVADVMNLVFHVPDALLGALAYVVEIILALAGSSRRWQYRPWLVVWFGLNVVGLAFVSAALVCAQGLIVHSWCFLCLITAAVSFSLLALSVEEVYACLHYLWRVWKHSASLGTVWDTFWGRASPAAEAAALPGA